MRANVIRYIFCAFWAALLFSCASETKKDDALDMTIDGNFRHKIEQINSLFITNRFDSAEIVLLELTGDQNSFLEEYLIYCYQAEIMYYNLLPALAADNLDKAMAMAEKSGRPELIANCENFYGIFKIIEKKPHEANVHLDRAEQLFPKDSVFTYMVNLHQILANQAEVHLMLGQPDSAIYYTEKAFYYSQKADSRRGEALNHWTMGQALLDKNDIPGAKQNFMDGLEVLKNTGNGDVMHYLYGGLISAAVKENHKADAQKWILAGNDEALMDESSVLGQSHFFNEALIAAEYFGLTKQLVGLERKQIHILSLSRERELAAQSKILSKYYSKLEELNLMKQAAQQRRQYMMRDRFIQAFLLVTVLVMLLVILYNRKFLNQKIRLTRVESEAKIALLTKEKELGGIIARNTAIEEERTRISKELHDDIGSSVSSIKIYNKLALKEFGDNPEKARQLIEKSEEQIQQIEENLGDLIWAVYTKNETIQNLIMRMKQYAFDVLTAKEIQTKFNYPYQLNELKLPIEFRKNILLIFKEFVNNTAKYSGAQTFTFDISFTDENRISIKLCDDGVGFDSELSNMGKGLSNMQNRARTMGVTYFFNSSPGKGTLFEMVYTFPESV